VRSVVMDKKIADNLSYSSKFDRSQAFMDEMCREGRSVARKWLHDWGKKPGKGYPKKEYPEDAAYDSK